MILRAILILGLLGVGAIADSFPQSDFTRDIQSACTGRLTLTTATAITTSDVSASSIFFTPYGGAKISLYNGSIWQLFTFGETSLALSALTSDLNYDVFGYSNSGTLALELTAWTDATTRATAIVLQDGIYVKSGATTRRYLGTIRTTSTNTTEDSITKRYVWNQCNRVRRPLRKWDATGSWSYNTTSWRSQNNSTANRVEVVVGVAESYLELILNCLIHASANLSIGVGVCQDCTNSSSSYPALSAANTNYTVATASLRAYPPVGYHYFQAVEYGGGGGTTLFHGSSYSNMGGFIEG